LPTCDRRCTLEDALKLLQEKGAPAVDVLDGAGRLVGLVSSETLAEMLIIAGAMPAGVSSGRPTPAHGRMLVAASALGPLRPPRLLEEVTLRRLEDPNSPVLNASDHLTMA
jgi:CBS domain-containing protein